MTAQLEQILNYLDRDGVTEVIVGAGQPMQFRRSGALVSITAKELTRVQVASLVAGTSLAPLLGHKKTVDLQHGKRSLRIVAAGTAEAPSLVISRAPAPAKPEPAVAPANITERSRRTSRAGRASTSPETRSRAPSSAPRTKTPTRTKRPTKAEQTGQRDIARGRTPTPAKVTPVADKPPSRLTRSDIKFKTPAAPAPRARGPRESLPLDLDPETSGAPALDPPTLDLGARGGSPAALSLDLDEGDDLGIELGAPGSGARSSHQGSTRAIDAAFGGPPSPHHGSTPAIDAAFAGPAPLDLDDLGPRVSSTAPAPRYVAPSPPPAAAQPLGAAFLEGLPVPPPKPAPAPVAMSSRATVAIPPGLRALLDEATRRRASDLHVVVNRPPCVRVFGELVPLRSEVSTAAETEALLLPLLDDRGRAQLERAGYSDLAVETPTGQRLRTNLARCQGGMRGTFRIGRATPPTLDELGLPKELARVVAHHQGLVVIAGPSGHGKTTTLAALVDLINAASAFHIITVEDPIEIVYPRKAAVVSQREVGAHTKSFAAALKGSLREDPDVIVIGELRDRETVEIALTAAETGHLVLATMSTPSAAKTIDRLVDMFPPADQQQVRSSIAGALRAIVSQRLLPSTSGDGVVAAVELLTGVLPLAAMIRDDKLFQLPSLMQRGRAFGMIRLDDSLADLVRANKLASEVALAAAENRKELAVRLSQGTAAIPTMGRKM